MGTTKAWSVRRMVGRAGGWLERRAAPAAATGGGGVRGRPRPWERRPKSRGILRMGRGLVAFLP